MSNRYFRNLLIDQVDIYPTLSIPMAHTGNRYHLMREIVALSTAQEWETAKREWELNYIYFAEAEEPETCLCGHFPIIEVCVLYNKVNRNSAEVGNVCVKKFLGFPSDKIFAGFKRIGKSIESKLNEDAIRYAHSKKWVNDWELAFYLDIYRKRKFTDKQLKKLEGINKQILARFRQK